MNAGMRSSRVSQAARIATSLSDVALAHLKANAAATRQENPGKVTPAMIAVQIFGVAEDIVSGVRKDPAVVLELMQTETGKGLGTLGLATSAEVEQLREQVERLSARVDALLVHDSAPDPDQNSPAAAPAQKREAAAASTRASTAAKRTATKKAAGKRAAATSAVAKKPVAKKSAAKKPAAKRPAAKKPTAKQTAAKQAAARKTAAQQVPGESGTGGGEV